MKKMTTVIINIANDASIKSAVMDFMSLAPDRANEVFAKMLLSTLSVCDLEKTRIIDDKVCSFNHVELDDMNVVFSYQDKATRFFKTEEEAKQAIADRNRWRGEQLKSDEYPCVAEILYDNKSRTPIEVWIDAPLYEEEKGE